MFWRRKLTEAPDAEKINELLSRGVERIYPSREFLEKALKSGRRLTVYFGIDPTAPTLHLGHAIPLLKLRQFQELGHEAIVLYGGFTAQIGDPSGKNEARKPLTRREVRANARHYKEMIGRILATRQANLRFLNNEEWTNKLKPIDLLNLAGKLTVSQLLARDFFQERLRQGKEVYVNEFLYPMLQAYDAVTMDVDAQVGGNDQTFNMLMGRDLMKKLKGKEKFVVAMKLLVDPSGRKMGKTEGNMIAFTDAPADAFGKVMSWPDSMIISSFELCTRVPLAEIDAVKKQLESGTNPKEVKMKLAEAIAALLHGAGDAQKARTSFEAAFSEGKPEEFIEIPRAGDPMMALIEKGIVSSKTELRRLITAGAVTRLDSDTRVGEDFSRTFPAGKYRIGKHRFIEIK